MREPSALTSARGLAAGRVLLGAVLIALPGSAGRAWIGRDADRPGARLALRGLGMREAALGAGTLWALGRGGAPLPWIVAAAAVDAGDVAATVAARRELPPSGLLVLASASAAVGVGAWTAVRRTGA